MIYIYIFIIIILCECLWGDLSGIRQNNPSFLEVLAKSLFMISTNCYIIKYFRIQNKVVLFFLPHKSMIPRTASSLVDSATNKGTEKD